MSNALSANALIAEPHLEPRNGTCPRSASDATAIVEILTAEQRGETLTPARLAARIGLTSGATSTLLRRLETAGHVERSHDHEDRRIVSLRCTVSIHRTAAAFYSPLADALDQTLREFPPTDLETATRVIAALNQAASTIETGAR